MRAEIEPSREDLEGSGADGPPLSLFVLGFVMAGGQRLRGQKCLAERVGLDCRRGSVQRWVASMLSMRRKEHDSIYVLAP